MQEPYKTLADTAEDEFVEQRSRFIGAVSPAVNAEEAAAFIQKRRKLHPDARHHVLPIPFLTVHAGIPMTGNRRGPAGFRC